MPSEEERKVADKLADFVAKNGPTFEDMTRNKNVGDTPFKCVMMRALILILCVLECTRNIVLRNPDHRPLVYRFLHDTSCTTYKYYAKKLEENKRAIDAAKSRGKGHGCINWRSQQLATFHKSPCLTCGFLLQRPRLGR